MWDKDITWVGWSKLRLVNRVFIGDSWQAGQRLLLYLIGRWYGLQWYITLICRLLQVWSNDTFYWWLLICPVLDICATVGIFHTAATFNNSAANATWYYCCVYDSATRVLILLLVWNSLLLWFLYVQTTTSKSSFCRYLRVLESFVLSKFNWLRGRSFKNTWVLR